MSEWLTPLLQCLWQSHCEPTQRSEKRPGRWYTLVFYSDSCRTGKPPLRPGIGSESRNTIATREHPKHPSQPAVRLWNPYLISETPDHNPNTLWRLKTGVDNLQTVLGLLFPRLGGDGEFGMADIDLGVGDFVDVLEEAGHCVLEFRLAWGGTDARVTLHTNTVVYSCTSLNSVLDEIDGCVDFGVAAALDVEIVVVEFCFGVDLGCCFEEKGMKSAHIALYTASRMGRYVYLPLKSLPPVICRNDSDFMIDLQPLRNSLGLCRHFPSSSSASLTISQA